MWSENGHLCRDIWRQAERVFNRELQSEYYSAFTSHIHILVPVNEKVPLWEAERIWVRCGPAVLQVQDYVWVCSLQEAHLNIHGFPEHFGDRVVCWSVEGAIRCLFCK